MIGYVGLTIAPQQQLKFQMPSHGYANYAFGPPHMSFLFQSRASHQFIMLVAVMMFSFYV